MEEKQRTVEEALWGWKDSHGQWNDGLVQSIPKTNAENARQFAYLRKLVFVAIGVGFASLGRIALPDILHVLVSVAQANGLPSP